MIKDTLSADLSAADWALLEACAPLAELEAATRRAVIEGSRVVAAPTGTVIIQQGDRGEAFYVLLSGSVELLRRGGDGRETPFAELGPGAYFGEQALLGATLRKRSATVRTTVDSRCAEFSAEVFQGRIARSGRNSEAFERNAAHFAYDEMRRSLEALASSRLDESAEGVSRVSFPAGATVIQEGQPSDAAFLVLEGVGLVVQTRGGAAREISHVGAGQVIGELGVLQDKPRSAAVIAESPLTALRIEARVFRDWYAAHPGATQFFDSLAEVYTLAEGRRLNVFLGDVDGHQAIITVRGEPTDGVVSTRILDRGIVVFANAGADAVAGERETVSFSEGSHERELRVIVKTRKRERIETCVIHGVAAEGIGPDLGELYQRVAHLDELTALELRRFQRTGYLGGAAHVPSKDVDGRLCPCLGIGPAQLTAAISEVGAEFSALRTAIGVSTLCGGCESAVRTFTEQASHPPQATALDGAPAAGSDEPRVAGIQADAPGRHETGRGEAKCPVDHTRALEESGYPLRRIRRLLESWDATGDGRVRREDVALRFRGLGVRDMDSFLDTLFPGALPPNEPVSLTSLVETITRVMDFDESRTLHGPSYPARLKSSAPASAVVRGLQAGVRLVLRHRHALLALAAGTAVLAAAGIASVAYAAGPLWLLGVALAGGGTLGLLWRSPSLRYYAQILAKGEGRIYSAMFATFGFATKYAIFRPLGPFGPGVYYIRGEEMVEQILSRPTDYVRDSRFPLDTYPPFGVKSLLWGGTDGYWLGYRSVCEEYFVSGYEADIPEMTDIVRDRVTHWVARGEIDLLEEIYRIVLEIRARVFFQTSFQCFDENAAVDFADLVDRVLSGRGLFFVDDRDAALLHERVMAAVRGATRPGSVGHSLRRCLESGDLEEAEVLHNAVMYVLAQAPTMALFWTLYRAARTRTTTTLRGDRRAIVRAVKEEMRLHPPVTSMFFRMATRDGVIDGVAIPAGSPIFVCPLLIQTNPDHWTRPQQFDADRWTSAAGVAKEIVAPGTDADDTRARPCPRPEGRHPSRYLPFGAAAHACQGRWFASDEMLLVVDTVLDMVDLEVLRDDNLLDRELADQVRLHVYSRPANEVRLKVVPRQPGSSEAPGR